MELTKYEHACFTIKKDEQILIVDPGGFTTDFIAPERVIGVIITHQHSDHIDQERLADIIDKNPEAVIYGPSAVTTTIEAFSTQSVSAGDLLEIGPFTVEFFGGNHAVIHPSIPLVDNVGLLINDLLYYPGDSFTVPDKPVDTLALPVAAPWLKISETMDFLTTIRPRYAFPTHDAILSTVGQSLVDRLLQEAAQKHDIIYKRLTNSINL